MCIFSHSKVWIEARRQPVGTEYVQRHLVHCINKWFLANLSHRLNELKPQIRQTSQPTCPLYQFETIKVTHLPNQRSLGRCSILQPDLAATATFWRQNQVNAMLTRYCYDRSVAFGRCDTIDFRIQLLVENFHCGSPLWNNSELLSDNDSPDTANSLMILKQFHLGKLPKLFSKWLLHV